MVWTILGILIGIGLGSLVPITLPLELARYSAVGLLGIIDALVGATRASIQGRYSTAIFLSGLLVNMLLAVVITYFGDRLGLDLYLAVLVVFTWRLFRNVASIRYVFLTRFLGEKRVAEELFDTDTDGPGSPS